MTRVVLRLIARDQRRSFVCTCCRNPDFLSATATARTRRLFHNEHTVICPPSIRASLLAGSGSHRSERNCSHCGLRRAPRVCALCSTLHFATRALRKHYIFCL